MCTIKIGIVGTGVAASLHVKALSTIPEYKIIALYSRSKDKAKKFVKDLDLPSTVKIYTDYNQFLHDDLIELVDICTPSGTHLDFAIPAANAKKNLIIEKPLEITTARCDKIISAVEKNNVFLSVIFQNRYKPAVQLARRAIQDGSLGRLVLGTAEIKWFRASDYYQGEKGTELYGGALLNQGIHTIDLLQWLLGGDPKTVVGLIATRIHEIKVEDIGVGIVHFKSGAMGVIEAATCIFPGLPERLGLYGENGSIEIHGSVIKTWNIKNSALLNEAEKLMDEKQESGASSPVIPVENHRRQFLDILKSLSQRTKPLVDGEEARKSVAIIEGIYKSYLTQRFVHLE